MANEEDIVVYIDGDFVNARDAKISVFDHGFTRGDAVFDAARTFAGVPFQLKEHVARLLLSCRYLQLEAGLDAAALCALGEAVAQRNRPLLPRFGDFWITYHVTRGVLRDGWPPHPTLLVTCTPLPFTERALHYRDGIAVHIPSVRRVPPWAASPRVKSHNYLNFVVASLESKGARPGAWPILLDENGCLAEGYGSNLFLVKNGVLHTPEERYVLPGITRQTVLTLARQAGIKTREASLDSYDLRCADEAFLTSTSLCLCPVTRVDGAAIGGPGPITCQLSEAYSTLAGYDFRAQYLQALAKAPRPER